MKKEKSVVIPLSEYRVLIQIYERVNAVKRLVETQKFVTVDDIRALLDIEKDGEK